MFFFLSQAVDDSGVPGIDRVDSMAEYLVELRHQLYLALTNQQSGTFIVLLLSLCALSYIFTLMFCLFSRAAVFSLSVQMGSHPE